MGYSFRKYQGLGNDYLVCTKDVFDRLGLDSRSIPRICDRHYGVGADGILVWTGNTDSIFSLRIFNPDGSEAEKSGNGLRIFSRYLFDLGKVGESSFKVATSGGVVDCHILDNGKRVRVNMGQACFASSKIPVLVKSQEVLEYPQYIDERLFYLNCVSIGNPHCVIFENSVKADDAKLWGAKLETLPIFPNRTNVQFAEVIDRNNIRIEIWERGAGYTLASGSSSCAAASVAYKRGLCNNVIFVHMPGGTMSIQLSNNFDVEMTGNVQSIADIKIHEECFYQPELPQIKSNPRGR